jgi:hypothetical protein
VVTIVALRAIPVSHAGRAPALLEITPIPRCEQNLDGMMAHAAPIPKGVLMAGRQRTTFQKRQKEVKRREKQQMKAEKRAARKLEKSQTRTQPEMANEDFQPDSLGQPHSEIPS